MKQDMEFCHCVISYELFICHSYKYLNDPGLFAETSKILSKRNHFQSCKLKNEEQDASRLSSQLLNFCQIYSHPASLTPLQKGQQIPHLLGSYRILKPLHHQRRPH